MVAGTRIKRNEHVREEIVLVYHSVDHLKIRDSADVAIEESDFDEQVLATRLESLDHFLEEDGERRVRILK